MEQDLRLVHKGIKERGREGEGAGERAEGGNIEAEAEESRVDPVTFRPQTAPPLALAQSKAGGSVTTHRDTHIY